MNVGSDQNEQSYIKLLGGKCPCGDWGQGEVAGVTQMTYDCLFSNQEGMRGEVLRKELVGSIISPERQSSMHLGPYRLDNSYSSPSERQSISASEILLESLSSSITDHPSRLAWVVWDIPIPLKSAHPIWGTQNTHQQLKMTT